MSLGVILVSGKQRPKYIELSRKCRTVDWQLSRERRVGKRLFIAMIAVNMTCFSFPKAKHQAAPLHAVTLLHCDRGSKRDERSLDAICVHAAGPNFGLFQQCFLGFLVFVYKLIALPPYWCQNKSKVVHIVCIKMEDSSQTGKTLLFLTTNMAGMT